MKKYITLFVGFVMGLGLATTSAQEAGAKHSLSEFELGEHVSGEKRKLSKLKGKVVVLEYWGTR